MDHHNIHQNLLEEQISYSGDAVLELALTPDSNCGDAINNETTVTPIIDEQLEKVDVGKECGDGSCNDKTVFPSIGEALKTVDAAKEVFFATQRSLTEELAGAKSVCDEQKTQLTDLTMDLLDEEKRAHDTNMQNILAQLEPARLQFSHLQRTLEALKENCQKTNTFSVGAFDKVSQLSKEMQKQNELIFNIEQKCGQLRRTETARYQKKRSELWMALLPEIEQKNNDYTSFAAKRYDHLQGLAREMNRAKNVLQKIKSNSGDDSTDIITIDGSPPSKCAKIDSFLAKSSAHQIQNSEESDDNVNTHENIRREEGERSEKSEIKQQC
uniref:Uncharacterized protein n=1 Tax=Globodera rostochiensis TaxID=31243 RepID=A0A914I723_GLORO